MRPEKFIENFSTHLKNIIASSISLATRLGHDSVTPTHILFSITGEPGSIGAEILYRTKLNVDRLAEYLESLPKTVQTETPTKPVALPELDKSAKMALEKAMLLAYERKHNYIGTEHLLYGLIKINNKELIGLFKEKNIKSKAMLEEIEHVLQSTSHFPDMENINETTDQMQDIADLQNPNLNIPLSKPKSGNQPAGALGMFTTNLTDKVQAAKFDPVIGREKEIDRLIHILSRRTKNNPVLVGEPGVGKTAIVEGFAKRISEGSVPDILKKKKVLSLDLTLLISGTIYRGEFESRLKQIIDEVSNKPDYILFIDELHNIIGAGSNQGTMDAANILKPALSRGLLHCIGATTRDEYTKHISSDPALERRFQSINVEEPSTSDTLHILKGIKIYYEKFHHVNFTDDALDAAVEMSNRYVHDNFLPDKAIDLIDEAAAYVRSKRKSTTIQQKYDNLEKKRDEYIEQKYRAIHDEKFDEACDLKEKAEALEKKINIIKAQLDESKTPAREKVSKVDVAHILSNRINIPIDFLLSNEWDRLQNLSENIKKNIIGQDQAVDQLTQTLHQSYLRLSNKKRPFASFIFAGPSGVGKTELAKVLAKELYQDEKSLIKLDMSEFSEQHSVSRLLGSPAGYIGYKERNRFTDQLQQKPYAVLLFDEFDKAHIDVQRLLLQILDEGELTDGHGKKIHLHHSIIILTTNLGADLFRSTGIGFGSSEKNNATSLDEKLKSTILNKLKEELGASLFSRIQTTCLFSPLQHEHVQEIIRKNLAEMNESLKTKQQLEIIPDTSAITNLALRAHTIDTGVRNADKIIQEIVHDLVIKILQQKKRKKEYTLTQVENQYKLI